MKTELQRIEDVENPIIGRFYLVPCFQRKNGVDMPIIGPWHEDADIGTPSYHFHNDVRFLSDRQLTHSPSYELGKIETPEGFKESKTSPPVVYRRRKMQRQMPDFPLYGNHGKHQLIKTLEAKFKTVRMKCLTCPHRGMSLKGLPVNADGTVVCNGHGLKWNVKTGEMVER